MSTGSAMSASGTAPATAHDQPAVAGPGARQLVPGLWRFFWSELRLVFGRPRNQAMLAVLAVVPIGLGVLLRLVHSGGAGGGAPPFLNQLAGNGVFLAVVVLVLMLSLPMLPLAIGIVAGDAIAGEAALGTLRGLLAVPAGRVRLLVVKYAALVTFALAACLIVTLVALAMGLVLFPAGPVTTLSGTTISLGAGVVRVLVVAVYSALALASLGAIGLAASTLTQHPLGAAATVLVVVIGSEIADQVPQLSAIHAYLPTHWWLSWGGLFRAPTDWTGVQHGLLSFAVYLAIFGAIAWARLTSADITS
jgi:ABC-type transport system involved in multi-copper enzyme maturation permease subunit